jgi:hypothetical protein
MIQERKKKKIHSHGKKDRKSAVKTHKKINFLIKPEISHGYMTSLNLYACTIIGSQAAGKMKEREERGQAAN